MEEEEKKRSSGAATDREYQGMRSRVSQKSAASAPLGTTLLCSARRKPSGISSATVRRPWCLSQFRLSSRAEPQWVPRSSGEVRSDSRDTLI